jgi:hypothetical protein
MDLNLGGEENLIRGSYFRNNPYSGALAGTTMPENGKTGGNPFCQKGYPPDPLPKNFIMDASHPVGSISLI